MVDNSTPNIRFTTNKGESFRTRRVVPKKASKDFKKVLGKEKREGREHSKDENVVKDDKGIKSKEKFALGTEEVKTTPKKAEVSLFELASKVDDDTKAMTTELSEEELPVQNIPDEVRQESLSALFKGYGSKDKLKSLQMEADSTKTEFPKEKMEPTIAEVPLKQRGSEAFKEISKKTVTEENIAVNVSPAHLKDEKGKYATQFAQEQPDLSTINPMAGMQAPTQTADVKGTQQPKTIAPQIQEIIDQIIDKIYTLKVDGQTDTVITLKHPPLFANTNVVVSAFESAKGEFNIAFENLTQAAKQVLDMRNNQESLKFALEQKGYAVHIVTTTTLMETTTIAEREGLGKGYQEDSGSNEQRKREDQEEKDS